MRFARGALFVAVAVVFLSAVPAAAQGVGNSGTIKIATVGSPTSNEDNEPHVAACVFRADYYGFRAATYNVTITGVAPTGGGQLTTDTVVISESANGNTYQTSKTYDLTGALSSITPHEQQGYHIRYDAKRAGSPGQGSKTKVFWLDCSPTTTGGAGVRGRTIRKLTDEASVLGTRFSRRVGGLATTGTGVEEIALGGIALTVIGGIFQVAGRRRRHARR